MFHIGGSLFGTGVVHSAAYSKMREDPVGTTKRLLIEPGIDAVEGAWRLEEPERNALRAHLSASGCAVIYVCGGIMRADHINPSARDPAERAIALRKLEGLVQTAVDYGARMMLVCSGPDTEPENRSEAKDLLAAALRHLCSYAEKLRPHDPLWITLEHFDRELDQKRLLGPTRETVEVVADVRREHSNIGITLDLSHLVQLGEDPGEAVGWAGDLVIHAHVANCGLDRAYPKAFGDSHCRFGLPGGAIDAPIVSRFLAELAKSGYGRRVVPSSMPIVSIEMKPADDEAPDILISNGLRMLRHAAAAADCTYSTGQAPRREIAT